MSIQRTIRQRRGRRKIKTAFDLQLTSLLDVMVIILVFLLKSASVSTNTFTTTPGIELPASTSQIPPHESMHLIITPTSLIFENEKIMEFSQSPDTLTEAANATYEIRETDLIEGGLRIVPLYNALIIAKDAAELLRIKSKARDEDGNPLPFDGVLAIQADKRVKYDLVRKIMYTAGSAGFKVFQFLAMRREDVAK